MSKHKESKRPITHSLPHKHAMTTTLGCKLVQYYRAELYQVGDIDFKMVKGVIDCYTELLPKLPDYATSIDELDVFTGNLMARLRELPNKVIHVPLLTNEERMMVVSGILSRLEQYNVFIHDKLVEHNMLETSDVP